MDSFELLAVPLFLLMSNVLLKGGVGKDLFSAVQSWVGHWPGGLGIATILSCGIFSAISGSSVATAATIGTVAMPEMESRGYERSFILGLLAAGGTLGIMIPPSIPLIIYGVITESSIPTLFMAGIGPGLSLIIIFIAFSIYSAKKSGFQAAPKATLQERYRATIMAIANYRFSGCDHWLHLYGAGNSFRKRWGRLCALLDHHHIDGQDELGKNC